MNMLKSEVVVQQMTLLVDIVLLLRMVQPYDRTVLFDLLFWIQLMSRN